MPWVPAILDFEASGLAPESYPIEVGYILSGGERYCALIKPAPDWTHWDHSAQAMHGISREMLASCGQPVRQVCEELNQRLDGCQLYSDGWVVDRRWLDLLFCAAGLAPRFRLSPIESIQSECQHRLWDKVASEFRATSPDVRHRASADAAAIQQIFLRTRAACGGR